MHQPKTRQLRLLFRPNHEAKNILLPDDRRERCRDLLAGLLLRIVRLESKKGADHE